MNTHHKFQPSIDQEKTESSTSIKENLSQDNLRYYMLFDRNPEKQTLNRIDKQILKQVRGEIKSKYPGQDLTPFAKKIFEAYRSGYALGKSWVTNKNKRLKTDHDPGGIFPGSGDTMHDRMQFAEFFILYLDEWYREGYKLTIGPREAYHLFRADLLASEVEARKKENLGKDAYEISRDVLRYHSAYMEEKALAVKETLNKGGV
ncbi:hypothetical protein [Desulfobacula toluolica]|uniref:Uncharacterized protein n=1 Tax=Desulfobacula toluolica (strain DSM 7467 / Tol2) TaxID=651182 RepID=K0NCX5_DESTT|nr:hypothetical protein [Desulfobacula toluolica]CCK82429.1 uncharacterized protein TOL2_C42730 [Desulfobacula toluolica Tol2]